MKDGKPQAQIATLLDRHKSTISRDLARNTVTKGCRPKQACLFAEERSLGPRNSPHINPKDWDKTVACLHKNWSPGQIADQVGINHETIYRHVYADKVAGGSLYQHLCFQTKRKKRYASGHVRRSQIVDGRPISERPVCIEAESQIGHWENDTVNGVHHKQAVVAMVERKSGYAVSPKSSIKPQI